MAAVSDLRNEARMIASVLGVTGTDFVGAVTL
jgi:hypothetical protein